MLLSVFLNVYSVWYEYLVNPSQASVPPTTVLHIIKITLQRYILPECVIKRFKGLINLVNYYCRHCILNPFKKCSIKDLFCT